jgi:hypothetical protein
MKRITRMFAAAAVGAAVALAPLNAALAAPPVSCNGTPENPDAYVCIVRLVIGVVPYVYQDVPGQTVGTPTETVGVPSQTVGVADQTVGVGPQTVGVPARSVHIPQVCAGLNGFCVGPFDPSTPPVSETTPGVSQTVPGVSETTPAVSETIPAQSVTTDPIHSPVPLVGVALPTTAAVVLWYKGKCYYVYPNATTTETSSATPSGCP